MHFRYQLFTAEQELKADLWLSPSHHPQEKTVKTEGKRDVRINKWFSLFEDVRQRRLSCVPTEAHTDVDNTSDATFDHVLRFLSLQWFHNQLFEVILTISFILEDMMISYLQGYIALFWCFNKWESSISAALPGDHQGVRVDRMFFLFVFF